MATRLPASHAFSYAREGLATPLLFATVTVC